jgi:hypothetical protein
MKKEKRAFPIMTAEWLRSFKGFEHYSDERIKHALETIRSLAHILIESKHHDNLENK